MTESFAKTVNTDVMENVVNIADKYSDGVFNIKHHKDKVEIEFGAMSPEIQSRMLRTPGLIGIDAHFNQDEHKNLSIAVTPENVGRVNYMFHWMTTELKEDKKFDKQDVPTVPPSTAQPQVTPTITPKRFAEILNNDVMNNVTTIAQKYNLSAIMNQSGNKGAVIKFGGMSDDMQSRILRTPGLIGIDAPFTKDEHNKLAIKVTAENVVRVNYMLHWMTTELKEDKKFKNQDLPKVQPSTAQPSSTMTPKRFSEILNNDLTKNVSTIAHKHNISAVITESGNKNAVIKFGGMSDDMQKQILKTPGLIGIDAPFTKDEHNKLSIKVTPENIVRVNYMLHWMSTQLKKENDTNKASSTNVPHPVPINPHAKHQHHSIDASLLKQVSNIHAKQALLHKSSASTSTTTHVDHEAVHHKKSSLLHNFEPHHDKSHRENLRKESQKKHTPKHEIDSPHHSSDHKTPKAGH